MSAWYVAVPGKCWKLCQVTGNLLGRVTVRLYDGTLESGILRREKYGLFVDAR